MNRQVLKSRKLLQNSLLSLLKRKEFRKITITELCKEANLSRRTYYDHFETREELISSIVDDLFSQLLDEAIISLSDSLFFDSSNTEDYFFEFWKSNQETLTLLRQAKCDSTILNAFYNFFTKLHHEAILKNTSNDNPVMTEYTLKVVSASYYAVIMHWDDRGMREPPELLEQYVINLLNPKSFLQYKEDFSKKFDQYS